MLKTKVDSSLLFFSPSNAKLGRIYSFSLPSGYTCPGALQCLSRADKETGKITDGLGCLFRCFSASQEATYPNVRISRWNNYEKLRGLKLSQMVKLITKSLPQYISLLRVGVAGDFYNSTYFRAWMIVAKNHPNILFYAYTKNIPVWLLFQKLVPSNFKLIASIGGKYDDLVFKHNLRFARVVGSVKEARALGLPLSGEDDSMAYETDLSFAMLVHSTQPAGSVMARCWQALKKSGHGGYSRAKAKI